MYPTVVDIDALPDRRAFRTRLAERLNAEAATKGEMRVPQAKPRPVLRDEDREENIGPEDDR